MDVISLLLRSKGWKKENRRSVITRQELSIMYL